MSYWYEAFTKEELHEIYRLSAFNELHCIIIRKLIDLLEEHDARSGKKVAAVERDTLHDDLLRKYKEEFERERERDGGTTTWIPKPWVLK